MVGPPGTLAVPMTGGIVVIDVGIRVAVTGLASVVMITTLFVQAVGVTVRRMPGQLSVNPLSSPPSASAVTPKNQVIELEYRMDICETASLWRIASKSPSK